MKNDMRALLAFATAVTLTAGGFTAAAGAAAAEVPTTVAQAPAEPAAEAAESSESPAPTETPAQPETEEAPPAAPGTVADVPVPGSPLADAGSSDPAESQPTGAAALALDPAPAAPVIEAPGSDFVSVDAAGGAVGTRVPLTVGGAALPGARVEVTFVRDETDSASQAPVTTTADAEGGWAVTVLLESGDWLYAASQQVVDPAGVVLSERSAASTALGVRLVAVTAPAPTLDGPASGAVFAAVPGASSPFDGPAARVPVSGTGTPGAVVRFILVGTEVVDYDGAVVVGADGSWATTVPAPVGAFRVSALQDHLDEGGLIRQSSPSVQGAPFTVVEASALPAPVVSSPTSGAVFDTDAPGFDGYVGVVAEGTGVPGAVLLPFIGTAAELEDYRARNARGEIVPSDYPIVVDSSGHWKIAGAYLPGSYLFTVVQYDPQFATPVSSVEAPVVQLTVRAPRVGPVVVPAANDTSLVPRAARPAPRNVLAHTGADHAGDAALAGLALLVLGSAAALLGRRRRRA